VTDKKDDWHFEEIQNGGGRQLVYSKMVIFATLFLLYGVRLHHLLSTACISQISRRPVDWKPNCTMHVLFLSRLPADRGMNVIVRWQGPISVHCSSYKVFLLLLYLWGVLLKNLNDATLASLGNARNMQIKAAISENIVFCKYLRNYILYQNNFGVNPHVLKVKNQIKPFQFWSTRYFWQN